MSDPLMLPVGSPRAFTAPLGADINCVTARPGYSLRAGGPALDSNAGHETGDTADVRPCRIHWLTTGDIKVRTYYGVCSEGTGVGTRMYSDCVLTQIAGTVLDYAPDAILATGTTANFILGWPRR